MQGTRINNNTLNDAGLTWDELLASPGQRFAAYLVDFVLAFITVGIYSIVFLIMAHTGSSVGKRMIGIKVVKADGDEPGCITGVLLREIVGKFISAIIILLGFVWIAMDNKR